MTNHQCRWTGQKRSTTAAGRITRSANSRTSTGAPPQMMLTTAETPLCRVTTTTRPDPHLKIQQPSKPLPPPEPPPPQPRRPRPGTATRNHVRQRAANHHPSGLTLPRLKSQPRQGTRGGTAPGDAPDGQRIELEQLTQRTLSGSGPGNHSSSWDNNGHGSDSAGHQSEESARAANPSEE